MTLETLTTFFGWMAVLNIALLLLGSLALMVVKDWASDIHARFFHLEPSFVRETMYAWLGTFKTMALVLSLVPYLALRLM